LDLVFEAAFGLRTWLVSIGSGILMLFIAAADPKSWSVTEVLFYALGTIAFVAIIVSAITALIHLRRSKKQRLLADDAQTNQGDGPAALPSYIDAKSRELAG